MHDSERVATVNHLIMCFYRMRYWLADILSVCPSYTLGYVIGIGSGIYAKFCSYGSEPTLVVHKVVKPFVSPCLERDFYENAVRYGYHAKGPYAH